MEIGAWLLLGFTYTCFCIHGNESIIRWSENTNEDETIMIHEKYLKDSRVKNANETIDYYKKVNPLKKYNVDEKCEKGLDFGVGFQVYTPYVDIGVGSSYDINAVSGILPHVTKDIMKYCCPKSVVSYGHYFKSILEIEEHFEDDPEIDISFPVYGLQGPSSTQLKDFPLIPIVTAPKIVILVPEWLFQDLNTRTQVLMKTIFNAWPMLIFIIVSAMLAGLAVWLLDKKKNSQEFPPTFFSGAWEGIWWAFVTMTTVGYGDRSPKSPYARAFCIMWILMGIILISLFTGLVTAALSASATPVFNVAGSKIGAVRGSMEFQTGVGLNAEMRGFENHHKMLETLMTERVLHAVMIDNFILSASSDVLERIKLRVEREIDYPVTYGIVMRKNSTKTEECFRRYVRHYPQQLFETIAKKLKPVHNPTDEVRLEVAAAEKLFYEEPVFKTIVYSETGLLVIALVLGVLWEIFVRNKDSAAYRMVGKFRNQPKFAEGFDLDEKSNSLIFKHNGSSSNNNISQDLDSLITEYSEFHSKWVDQVKNLHKRSNNLSPKVNV